MNLPTKFLTALSNILSKGDKRSQRLEKALTEDPEKAAEHVANELGSSTQPIKLSPRKLGWNHE